jgi:Uma2 family endonuclease
MPLPYNYCPMLFAIFGPRRVRVQSPIEVASAGRAYNFPEPGLSVRAKPRNRSIQKHPVGSDLALVVEITDCTLRADLTMKRDLNARAGVPEYWVLNRKGRKLIAHREPRKGLYTSIQSFLPSDTVHIEGRSVKVADMLP